MDEVITYLENWRTNRRVEDRVSLMIEAYRAIRADGRLSGWRFHPSQRRSKDTQPMYCAFLATPFPSNDVFLLRCTKGGKLSQGQNRELAIGFCPDYGDQSAEAMTRRRLLRNELKNTPACATGDLAGIEYPETGRGPNAYKGFETKIPIPNSAKALADKFITTVLAWESPFRRLMNRC